jgi:hypothetical protein
MYRPLRSIDTNQQDLPSSGTRLNPTPTTNWWSQPPDLLKHPPWVDTYNETQGLDAWFGAFATPPPIATSIQLPEIMKVPIPNIDTCNETQGTVAWFGAFATPPPIATSIQLPELLKVPIPNIDTCNETQGLDAWFGSFANVPLARWWSQPPDLLKHAPPLDTNFWTLPFATLSRLATPTERWWSQPPDLLRHPTHLDTNEPRLVAQQWATPGVFWWDQPPDLLKHAPPLDTNQPRLVAQQWATPQLFWWSQPPDLLRHPPELFADQPYLPPFPSFPGLTPVAIGFWAQPPDLFRHSPHLDANQGFDYAFDVWSRAPAGTPSALWWAQPPDLLRHPTHLDTNQPFMGRATWEPSVWWWSQPPDLLHRALDLDTNQLTIPYLGHILDAPQALWWSQPPDLLRHPPVLDTNQGLDLWYAPLSAIASLTPYAFWWSQPPDLLHKPPSLAVSTPRQAAWFDWTPAQWWSQPPDLLRHPAAMDTNQGVDYAFDVLSRAPAVTPSIFWWAQPPDLLHRLPPLDTNQSRLVQQPGARMWWLEPPFLPLRPPILLPLESYVAPGWAFTGAGPFIAPPPLNRPVALTQPPGLALLQQRILLPVFTPGILWWSQPPDLLRHAPELFTWHSTLGALLVSYDRDLVALRGRLSIPAAAPRHTSALKAPLSDAAAAPRKTYAPRVVSGLIAANTIMRGYGRMSRAPDLCPPIVAGVEQEYVQFDFALGLPSGAIIAAIVAVNCYSLSGTDPNPMSRILSVPAIIDSPSSKLPNQAVYALFGNMIAGLYLLQAIVQTSDGQTLSVEARWPCVNATP